MKQRFLLLFSLILFASVQLHAQITLTANDYLQIGDVIFQATDSATVVTPGPAGTNQVWDFTNLAGNDTARIEGVAPGTTPFADSFPTANLATLIQLSSDTAYTFQRLTGDRLDLLGLGISLLVEEMPGTTPISEIVRYNSPRTQAEFPVTFGNTFTSSSNLQYAVEDADGMISITQNATHTSTIDGWGTVVMPGNITYPALREQVITNSTDTISIEVAGEQPFVIVQTSIDTSYNFLSRAAKGLLVSFTPTLDPLTNERDGYTVSYYVEPEGPAGDAPVANFVFAIEGTTGNVEFTDLSANTPTSWSWDFGDGNSSTLQNPSHTYASSDTYEVCLTASNEFGSNTTCRMVPILVGDPPVAAFAADPAADGSGQVTFTDRSTDPLTWQWDFGDGSEVSNEQNPVHTYDSTGTYDVCLVVGNEFGIDTVCQMVAVVVGQAPVANFAVSIQGETGEVMFTDQSTNEPVSWDWAFGDGNVSTEQNPTHAYAASGTYTVQLIAGNDFGTDTASQEVTVVVTSINELPDGSHLLIAPNPFADQLNLQLTNWNREAAELLIYDAAGRLQHRTTLRDQVQINTTQWARGTYHYQLRSTQGILRAGQLVRQ